MRIKLTSLIIFALILFTPVVLFAAGEACGPQNTSLCNPVTYATDVKAFIINLLEMFTGFFALQAMVYVVYSGFRMITAQGNEETITTAKNSLQWAIIGLVLALFAFVIISAIANAIGIKDLGGILKGANEVQNPLEAQTFYQLVQRILESALGLIGILSIGMIIFGGFKYMTAQGHEEQIGSAKKTIQWAVIGLLVSLLAYVIIKATLGLFGRS